MKWIDYREKLVLVFPTVIKPRCWPTMWQLLLKTVLLIQAIRQMIIIDSV